MKFEDLVRNATLAFAFLSFLVVGMLYVTVRPQVQLLQNQMGWIERKFDQGKLLVTDTETLEELEVIFGRTGDFPHAEER